MDYSTIINLAISLFDKVPFLCTVAEWGFGSAFVLWVFFLAIMNLQRVYEAGNMTPWAKRFAIVVLFIGAIVDVLVNLTLGTAMFFAAPVVERKDGDTTWQAIRRAAHSLTLSARVSLYYNEDEADQTRRKRLAVWLAVNLINPYDMSPKPHID